MKRRTLIKLQEMEGDKFILTDIEDYPIARNGKVLWPGLDLDNLIATDGDEKWGIKLMREEIYLSSKEKIKLLESASWKQVTTMIGQELLFPPDPRKHYD